MNGSNRRTMSGLFEHHATLAQRFELLISQRDLLDEALAWLDADPRRLSLLAAERERQIAAIRSEIARWPSAMLAVPPGCPVT